jgi:hypothetical protein
MPRVQRPRHFKWPWGVRVSVFLSVLGWMLAAAALVCLVQVFTAAGGDLQRQRALAFFACLGAYLVVRLVTFFHAMRLKCPLCHGPVLHEKRCHMHRDARRIGFLSYRVSAILDILAGGVFNCMYCGTPFRLRK